VWADALLNYLSAIGWPERKYSLWWLAKDNETGGAGAAREDEFQHLDGQGKPGAAWAGTAAKKYTNALHLIGKDISRFHCILSPALLLAAGVPLPRQIYVHGFIYAKGGKLSSRRAVVDPVELASVSARTHCALPAGRDPHRTRREFTLDQPVEHCNTHSRTTRQPGEPQRHHGAQASAARRRPTGIPPRFRIRTRARPRRASPPPPGGRRGARRVQDLRVHEALGAAWVPVVRANEFISA
jgi:hypothetical protein